mmetsp:Transcript_25638/g.64620  ORF Transcript_25638/g.64620 Transcript_25638/m.64620 type:complete len:393 (-) Transcript_25638:139-1317(-)
MLPIHREEGKKYYAKRYAQLEDELQKKSHEKVVRKLNMEAVMSACVCFAKKQREKRAAGAAGGNNAAHPAAAGAHPPNPAGGAAQLETQRPDEVPREIAHHIWRFLGGIPLQWNGEIESHNINPRLRRGCDRLFDGDLHCTRLQKLAQKEFGLAVTWHDTYESDELKVLLYPVGITKKPSEANGNYISYQFEYAAPCANIGGFRGRDRYDRHYDLVREVAQKKHVSIPLEELCDRMRHGDMGAVFSGRTDGGVWCGDMAFEYGDIESVTVDDLAGAEEHVECAIEFGEQKPRDSRCKVQVKLAGAIGGSFSHRNIFEYDGEEFRKECENQNVCKDAKFLLQTATVKIEVPVSATDDKFDAALKTAKLLTIPVTYARNLPEDEMNHSDSDTDF